MGNENELLEMEMTWENEKKKFPLLQRKGMGNENEILRYHFLGSSLCVMLCACVCAKPAVYGVYANKEKMQLRFIH